MIEINTTRIETIEEKIKGIGIRGNRIDTIEIGVAKMTENRRIVRETESMIIENDSFTYK
jgi:coenzyme F420-reducing hydrogenase delta subunit